jgi:hypothetical protein
MSGRVGSRRPGRGLFKRPLRPFFKFHEKLVVWAAEGPGGYLLKPVRTDTLSSEMSG